METDPKVVGIVLGLVQLVKMTADNLSFTFRGRTINTVPVIAVFFGVCVGAGLSDTTIAEGIIEGIIASLVAMGVWSGTKSTIGSK